MARILESPMTDFGGQINRESPVPLYAQVKQTVRGEILRLNLKPGDRFPSENKLVRTLGLSRSTIARAIVQLAQDGILRRQKGVGTFIKRTNWLQSTLPEPLIQNQQQNQTMGSVLCLLSQRVDPEAQEEFYWPIICATEQALRQERYRASVVGRNRSAKQTEQVLHDIGLGHYAGVIIMAERDELLERLCACGIPLVTVVALMEMAGVTAVENDDEYGCAMGLDYLHSQGLRKIGIIGGPLVTRACQRRAAGCQEWARQKDRAKFDILHVSSFSPKVRKEEVRRFIEAHPEWDAVFGLHDSLAIAALAALMSMGVKVPEQTAVLGYDGWAAGKHIHPTLSTVAVDEERLGQMAAKSLLDQIQMGSNKDMVVHARIRPHLVRRESA